MIEQKGLGVLKKEKDSPSPSRFQVFDDALDELTRKLYDREYYNIPSSFISVPYNLELHRFQTIASSSWSSFRNSDANNANTRTDEENDKARYLSTRSTIVEIKTNRNESTYQMQPSKNTSCTFSISIYLRQER